ncbi:hypothetical protein NEOLI_002448 [Neolecta irregularis DAH-3]|uniref:Uncharacterized protein n=1 Tax=Neolecta irregularis (strain DAH-3) TaxID=1198029 RepID=A0A1U7LV49_NEOID|nr:hypothetical protein NEOLI_002448 [Neolecta irregularis DAH-3]|eukprot:OLL26422.1 hypothetical protein NEOLI_002448 [Neolecta irregularis DAH-3]
MFSVQLLNPAQTLPFILCQNRDQEAIPSNADPCGFSYPDCVYTKGKDLLSQSAERTRRLGVDKSCTVFIDGKQECIRDNDQWINCPDGGEVGDFVKRIELASKKSVYATWKREKTARD